MAPDKCWTASLDSGVERTLHLSRFHGVIPLDVEQFAVDCGLRFYSLRVISTVVFTA